MQHLSDCTAGVDEACCCPEDLKYEVVQDKNHRGVWRAEAVDYKGEGECYIAAFSGYDAEARAREYAEWKNEQRPPWAKDNFVESVVRIVRPPAEGTDAS